MRIGLDAMGGDNAPECTVKGAVEAVNEYGYDVTLIGSESEIKKRLEGLEYPKDKIDIVDAAEVIEMQDPAALSVRKKRNSSIVKGAELLKATLSVYANEGGLSLFANGATRDCQGRTAEERGNGPKGIHKVNTSWDESSGS